jgi:transcriptional regulator with XRE-family HTH domain
MTRLHPIVAALAVERSRLQLSCREVARRAGIHAQQISRYERGENWPTLAALDAWAAALGVTLAVHPTAEAVA